MTSLHQIGSDSSALPGQGTGTSTAPITVGLVQINNSFSGQNYLPYSAALLQTYVEKHSPNPDRYRFLIPIYKRTAISEVVDALLEADVVGFSTYVWNGQISLEIARRLKKRKPDIVIVFGGPHVPDQPEEFLRQNTSVDIAAHNEGEDILFRLLEMFPERDWEKLSGVSFIKPDGSFVRIPNGPRFRELDTVPSPFLEGAFDKLIAANPNERWIGLWETNRGCPFRCTFCDWGSATAAKVTKFSDDRLFQEAEWFGRHGIEYVFVCDANFGIQKRDVELARYVAQVKERTGYPKSFSVQSTKNQTDRAFETHKILADAGLNKGVVLSMQSLDPTTLVAIKRDNISLKTYDDLQRKFTRDGVETYSDLILGLPGETYESFIRGVDLLIQNGQHNRIQFNNLSILPNAEMGDPAYQAEHGIVTIKSKIINLHGEHIELEDDVDEEQDLVVCTDTMTRDDWCRTRVFCWMTALLHFDKLFQLPLILAHQISGIAYQDMIEAFLDADPVEYPTIAWISDLFWKEARSIQQGGAEWVFAKEYLGIYWTADEYVFIKLTDDKTFDAFYGEAEKLVTELVTARNPSAPIDALQEASTLNHAMVRQPFVRDDITIETNYDLLTFWKSIRDGLPADLNKKPTVVLIDRSSKPYDDFQEWCREVVWWGNKRGAYLYTNQTVEKQLAGHY